MNSGDGLGFKSNTVLGCGDNVELKCAELPI
jgi:hypothetical protein